MTVSVEQCIRLVSTRLDVRREDIVGHCRARHIVRPRQLAYWLARYATDKTLPQIARVFGERHHTTIISGIQAVSRGRADSVELLALSDELLAELTHERAA